MKKTDVGLFFTLFSCGGISFFVLLWCFDKSLNESIESLLEAIFTGAIIALPSVLIALYNSLKDNSHELHLILIRTLEIVDSSINRLNKYESDNNAEKFFCSDLTETERKELVSIYGLITDKTGKLLFKKRETVIAIQESIDDYSRELLKTNVFTEEKIEKVNSILCLLKDDLREVLEHK